MRTALLALILLLCAAPVVAQTPAQLDSMRVELVRCIAFGKGSDTQATKALDALAAGDTVAARVEMVRSRGMVRALITQCDKSLVILDRARGTAPPDTIVEPPDTVIPDPPVEPDPPAWATGRWSLLVDGQAGVLDFDAATLVLPVFGVVVIDAKLDGDDAVLAFSLPEYGAGEVSLTHADGALTGTASVAGQSVRVTGAREVVQPDDPIPPTEPPPGDYPNMPAGLTVYGRADGSVREADGRPFGLSIFRSWSSTARNQQVVDDPSNPSGSGKSIRFTYHAGEGSAGVADASFPASSTLYIMQRIYLESGGWNFGHKFFYVGMTTRNNTGSPTQAYVDRAPNGRLRFINQNGTNEEIMDSSEGPPKGANWTGATPGKWLNIEYVFTASSLHVYVDGRLIGYRTGVNWRAAAFNGLQWYAKTDASVPSTSSYRLGELLIAGSR